MARAGVGGIEGFKMLVSMLRSCFLIPLPPAFSVLPLSVILSPCC